MITRIAAVLVLVSLSAAADDSEALLDRIEAYLDSITSLESRFVQTNQDLTHLSGSFQLKRPHFLRFAYDDPPTLIVARGERLLFRDGETGEITQGSVDGTPAQFLLRPKIRFGDDVRVADVRRDGGFVAVTLEWADEPGTGSISLILAEDPLALEQWLVRDAQGVVTRITLVNSRFDVELDNSLFELDGGP
ncbi:MAG: outer membrane lipoprotein carrier protein LolA [bacterium]|nr:outer membrane lipoprotein carrier protein LolA [bacterium]